VDESYQIAQAYQAQRAAIRDVGEESGDLSDNSKDGSDREDS
jgi:hypothetical protein